MNEFHGAGEVDRWEDDHAIQNYFFNVQIKPSGMPLSSCGVNMASPCRGRLVPILIYTGMRVLVISFGDKGGGGDIIKLSLARTNVIQAKHRLTRLWLAYMVLSNSPTKRSLIE